MINCPTNPGSRAKLTTGQEKLGEVCEIISPGIKKFEGIKKYVATADVDFDKIVNFSEITYSNRPSRANMETKENDALVARMAETKKFLVVSKELQNNYIFSTGFAVLRTKKDLLPKCLFYFLTTKDFNLQKNKLAVGATQKAINNPALKRIKIPILPLPIQQKIVERLDVVKKAQELNDKQIALAEELFQSLLHRELDPKGKNWKARRLGEVCEEIYRYPTYYNIKYLKRGIPEIRGELIMKDGTINLNKKRWRFIDRSTSERFPKTQLKSGDVVLSVRGTIGKIGFVPKELEGSNMTANLMRISPNRKRLKPRYFWFFLRSNFFQKSLLNILSSTTITTLRAPALKSLKISFPPIEIQRKIVEKLSAVQDYKKKLLEQKQKLNELFESVLNKSMKRELIK